MRSSDTLAPVPPVSKRALLARAIDALGLLDRLFWLRERLGIRTLAVLTYHRVGHARDAGELDPNVFDVTPDDLAEQLAVVKTHGRVVSLSEVRHFFRGRPLPPNPVLITFDDGYADSHDTAFPILRREGVPATFFIPTAFPDAGTLFWWDRITLLMNRCSKDHVEIAYPKQVVLHPRADPKAAAAVLLRLVKSTPQLDFNRLWDELERETGVVVRAAEERALAARTIMSWAQVRALAAGGMEVQSHSHLHRVLNTLSVDDARRDLATSAAVLAHELGRPPAGVAYPVGYELAGELRRAPGAAGFDLGFTNSSGVCKLDDFDAFNVPRIAMDPSTVGALYKLVLLMGGLTGKRAVPAAA